MEKKNNDQIELKLQRLEELLEQWKDETSEREEKLEKRLVNGVVKYVCIVVAALGAIWSVVELADWYWKKYELEKLATSYAQAADNGYQQTRNPEVALEIINQALEISPDDPELRYKQLYYQCHTILKQLPAQSYLYTAEDIKKLDMLSAGLVLQKELTPDNGELYLLEAMLLNRQGKYEEAVSAIETAIKKDAEYSYAQYLTVQNLIALKRYEDAGKTAEQLVADHGNSKYSHCARGRVFESQLLFADAAKSYEEALKIDDTHYDSLIGLFRCLYRIVPRDYYKERAVCKKIISIYPDDFAAYNQLIRSCISEENYALASLYLKRAERIFPETAGIYILQAELYTRERKFELAEKACMQAFQLIPEDVSVQRSLVTLHIASGNFRKAVEYNHLVASIAMERKSSVTLNNAAWRFYLIGTDYDHAVKLSKMAVKLQGNSYYYGTLACILFRSGNSKEALETIDRAIAVSGTSRKHVHLVEKALMLIELKRIEEAASVLKQAEASSPNYYRLFVARGEYHILTGNLPEAEKAVKSGEKYAANDFEKTELQMIAAKIKAASGDWRAAQILQQSALTKIDNNFSEIRIAYQNYALYSLRAGDITEAEKAIAILKTIDSTNKEIIALDTELQQKKKQGI